MIIIVVIFSFILQGDIFLYSQSGNIIESQFEEAKKEYRKGKDGKEIFYKKSINRLNDIITIVSEKGLSKEDRHIHWKSYCLLGANYERLKKKKEAKSNYSSARQRWRNWVNQLKEKGDTQQNVIPKMGKRPPNNIDEISLEKLKLAQKYFRGKKPSTWVPVLLGAAAVGVIFYLLLKKSKKPEKYTLTVTVGEGVEGSPASGSYTYRDGENVNYNYSLQSGYSNLTVTLDGNQVSESGSITMNQEHTLSVTSSANQPAFVTDVDQVTVPEGGTATFRVKLSTQPTSAVNATIGVSGDNDISVQSGSSLTFNTSNWNTFQDVTLSAAAAIDTENGTASIRITAFGIPDKEILVVENDNTPYSLTLCDEEGYDFSEKEKTNPSSGDLHMQRILGVMSFYSDYPAQRGITTIGHFSGDLIDVTIPTSGYRGNETAQTGHVYIVPDRNDNNYFIVFRVVNITSNCVTIEWIRKSGD